MKYLIPALALLAISAQAATQIRSCTPLPTAPYTLLGAPVAPAKTVMAYVSNSSVGTAPYCKLLSAMSPTAFVQTTVNGGASWVWQTIAGALAAVPPTAPPPVTPPPPATPPPVTPPSPSAGSVTLTWPALTVNVYRGSTAAALVKIATAATSPFIDTGVKAGDSVCYGITYADGTSESAPSVWCGAVSAPAAPALTVR